MTRISLRNAGTAAALALVACAACTSSDTGSIDLYGPAYVTTTGPGKPPPPPKPTPCARDADCPKGEPLCGSLAVCVQCFTSTDCKDAKRPACLSQTGACVECDLVTACSDPGKPLCDLASGSCLECVSNADCTRDPAKGLCDVAHGKCIACLLDTDCPNGQHCDKDGLCHK
jgi:hypothetical protein